MTGKMQESFRVVLG